MGEEVIYEPTPVLTKVTALRATLNEICERSYFIPAAFLDIIITQPCVCVRARCHTAPDELSFQRRHRHRNCAIIAQRAPRQKSFATSCNARCIFNSVRPATIIF